MSANTELVASAKSYATAVEDASDQTVYLLIYQLSRAYVAKRALPIIAEEQRVIPVTRSMYAFGLSLGDSNSRERFVNVLFDFFESYSGHGLLFGRTVLHIIYASSPPQKGFVEEWLRAFNMMFSAIEARPRLNRTYRDAFEAAQRENEDVESAWLNFEIAFLDTNLGSRLRQQFSGRNFKESIGKYVREKTLNGFDGKVDYILNEDVFRIMGPVV